MLKEFAQFFLDKASAEVLEINGRQYTTKPVEDVLDPEPDALALATLTGLVDYVKANVDKLALETTIVHVVDHATVRLLSALHGDFAQRDCILNIKADLLQMQFNTFLEAERFNIFVQACFQENDGRAAVLKCAGSIVEAAVRTTGDDGVSQEITVREGIQRKANQAVPNPVSLRPFRTFTEVEQPESQFVFRMQDGPKCMLVEADGGAWRNVARQSIKEYLAKALPEGITIIA